MYFRFSYFPFLFFAVTLVLIANSSNGQLPSSMPQDLSKIKVDDLSDSQIEQLLKKAKERGISEQDIEPLALSQGIPRAEIMKLQQRILSLRSGGSVSSPGASTPSGSSGRVYVPNFQLDDIIQNPVEKDPRLEKIFGASLFNNPNLTFEPSLNIPTPPNYQLGPGDEVIIDIWGASQESIRVPISPEGFIKINNLAPIYVTGLTVEDASKRVIARLTDIYSGLKTAEGRPANTFAMLTLGNVRSIQVNIVGEVNLPGTYTLPSLATVFNALYASGGPNFNGSFRKVKVIRGNKVIGSLDVYDFLLKGEQSTNMILQDQDVIQVSPFDVRVEVMGEVKKPGYYEVLDGESIQDIIQFAGNFTDRAFSNRLTISRSNGREKELMDIESDHFKDFKVENGDLIKVGKIIERYKNRVQIHGAVFKGGVFQLDDSLTISKLISKAEGVRGDAFMNRAAIYRTREDFSVEVIPFELGAVLRGEEDVLLQREDHVKIFSIYELKDEYYVEILGEINKKGTYPYYENMTLEDLVSLAGGFHEAASASKIEISRRRKNYEEDPDDQIAEVYSFQVSNDLRINKDGARFILHPFDKVVVRRAPNYEVQKVIKVEGEVLYPGKYTIRSKNERISEVIKRAGGLTRESYPKGATLIRYTEFHAAPGEYEAHLSKLQELKNSGFFKGEKSEGESQFFDRLQHIDFVIDKENDSRRSLGAAGIKKERLDELNNRDSLIGLSGSAYRESIGIDLELIMKNPGSKFDLLIQDGDILSIPKELQTVRVRGELLYPVTIRHENTRLRYYISQSGGFNPYAHRKRVYVIYPNGSVGRTRSFFGMKFYPHVEPGTDIIVPRKPARVKLTPQEAISLGSGIASLSMVIITIANLVGR